MTVDVRGRLVLDDETSGTLGKIRKGFDQTHQAQQHVQASMGFIKTAGAMAVGSAILPMVRGVTHMAEGFVHSARESMAFQRGMSGLIASVQGVSFDRARASATGLESAIERIGVQSGVAIEQIVPGFERMLEINGATEEGMRRTVETTKSLAIISRDLGLDMNTVSVETSMMSEGLLRTRGRMFQLLSTTGIFGDKVKGAAAYWSKLTEEERIKRLNQAMGTLAGKMGAQEMGLGGYIASIHNLIEIAKKEIGTPIARALTPFAKEFKTGLEEMMPALREFGVLAARDVAGGMKEATTWLKEGVDYVISHRAEIEAGFKAGAEHVKDAVGFVLEHRKALGVMAGLYYGGPAALKGAKAIGQYAPMVGGGLLTGGKMLGAGATALTATGGGLGAVIPAMAGAATPAVALTAALVGLTAAGWQAYGLFGDLRKNQNADTVARKEAIDRFISQGGMFSKASEEVEHQLAFMTNEFITHSEQVGMTRESAAALTKEYWHTFDASQKVVATMSDAAGAVDALGEAGKKASGMQLASVASDMVDVGGAFEQAAANHNAGAMNYIANMLGGSVAMQEAFLKSGKMSADAYEQLAGIVEGKSQEFAERLLNLAKGAAGGARPHVNVNMSGGQTFNIKQDFRDQDPDRVIVTFKNDMGKLATRRLQAHSATPFGT
jgi:hypothetical protein